MLAQAQDASHPLLERVKFLAIAGTNLDEFFMVRVATILKKFRAGIEEVSIDGLTHRAGTGDDPQPRARADRRADGVLVRSRCGRCWRPRAFTFWSRRTTRRPSTRGWRSTSRTTSFPVLTPLAFDPGHPFPYISNLSMNLAVRVRHAGRTKFARVKVPSMLPRFIALPDSLSPQPGVSYVFLEDVIRRNIQELFPGTQVEGAHLFRIIRDTDMVIQEDEADDLLETVDRGLKQLRYGALSLLQVEADMPRRVLSILIENFEVDEDVVVRTTDRLGFGDWHALTKLHRPALKDPAFTPRTLWAPDETDKVFEQIADQDFLVHHPFDSFTSVETFLRAAVDDPHVVAIKMTLYRIGAELAAGRPADRGRRAGQAGRGAGRAEGPLRRAQQHRVGDAAGSGRHPRRLRPGEPEGPLQAVPGRAPGGRRHPPLRARRHRQLQPRDLAGLHRPRAVHRRRGDPRRRHRGVQLADRLLEPALVQRAAGGAGRPAAGLPRAGRARDGARQGRPAGAHHHQEQRGRRPRR